MTFLLLFAVVFGILLLCFTATGIGLWLGRRKVLQACACEFDADAARAKTSPSCEDCPRSTQKKSLVSPIP